MKKFPLLFPLVLASCSSTSFDSSYTQSPESLAMPSFSDVNVENDKQAFKMLLSQFLDTDEIPFNNQQFVVCKEIEGDDVYEFQAEHIGRWEFIGIKKKEENKINQETSILDAINNERIKNDTHDFTSIEYSRILADREVCNAIDNNLDLTGLTYVVDTVLAFKQPENTILNKEFRVFKTEHNKKISIGVTKNDIKVEPVTQEYINQLKLKRTDFSNEGFDGYSFLYSSYTAGYFAEFEYMPVFNRVSTSLVRKDNNNNAKEVYYDNDKQSMVFRYKNGKPHGLWESSTGDTCFQNGLKTFLTDCN
ncbi:hypothetical protein [Photobacterium kasasachensis]|uniref:hypothetical protein n=1 Tax=Photobacterium kasasachensis TaxID=2910240 RepID=UPI003D135F03